MGTKTIGVREEVYERLKAQKRANESFTDTIDRLITESTTDWREGFGTLSTSEAEELETLTTATRNRTADGMSSRQQEALKEMAAVEANTDETA